MDTHWTLVLVAPVLLVLTAWITWLLFNLVIAKWYGVEGLKATPAIARAFSPREWAVLIPRLRQFPPAASETGTPAGPPEAGVERTEGGCV
ncbi:hypothetical protein [Streptomyces sp. NPDC088733]|uniref:hypothetical protein n=1 Tax=Streptomyces sp. NPDC088733 TaxID=3365880 RepID=UPI003813D789